MRRVPGEQCARPGAVERPGPPRWPERTAASPNRAISSGLSGNRMRRREHVRREARPFGDERAVQRAPVPTLLSQAGGGGVDGALQHGGRAVIERMGQRGRGLDPLEPEIRERERAEERRGKRKRVNRGAHVVDVAGQGELGGSEAAAQRRLRLPQDRLEPGAREDDCGREAVGSRSYDHRVSRHEPCVGE